MAVDEMVAVALLLVVGANLGALAYAQYASRSLLRDIAAAASGAPDVARVAAEGAEGKPRARMKALRRLRNDQGLADAVASLPEGLRARLRRYARVVLFMYASFALLVLVWLGGLLLSP